MGQQTAPHKDTLASRRIVLQYPGHSSHASPAMLAKQLLWCYPGCNTLPMQPRELVEVSLSRSHERRSNRRKIRRFPCIKANSYVLHHGSTSYTVPRESRGSCWPALWSALLCYDRIQCDNRRTPGVCTDCGRLGAGGFRVVQASSLV